MLYGRIRPTPTTASSIHNTDGPTMSFGLNTVKDIMTEADTFNALKKSTYEVVLNELQANIGSSIHIQDTIDKHGWKSNDFNNEFCKRNGISRVV
jgi:hypothetical protein